MRMNIALIVAIILLALSALFAILSLPYAELFALWAIAWILLSGARVAV